MRPADVILFATSQITEVVQEGGAAFPGHWTYKRLPIVQKSRWVQKSGLVSSTSRPRFADGRQHRGPGGHRRTSCLLPSQVQRPVMTARSTLHGPHPATTSKANAARKCVQCAERAIRKETRHLCQTCMSKPALCVVPCFHQYHTFVDVDT